jgi:predicted metal-dependent hydrolase
LKERKHSERFLELLEKAYPKWRQSKEELNQGILSYFEWGCQSNPKLKNVIN